MRVGQLEKAEIYYNYVIQNVKRKKWEFYAAANSNIAVLMMQMNRRKDLTIKFARQGLDAAARVYKPDTLEHYHHLRVLLFVLMFYNEHTQIEATLDEARAFPALERALFLAGMSYSKGRIDDAAHVLNRALVSVDYEVEANQGLMALTKTKSVFLSTNDLKGVDTLPTLVEDSTSQKASEKDGVVNVGVAEHDHVMFQGVDGEGEGNIAATAAVKDTGPAKIDFVKTTRNVQDLICYALVSKCSRVYFMTSSLHFSNSKSTFLYLLPVYMRNILTFCIYILHRSSQIKYNLTVLVATKNAMLQGATAAAAAAATERRESKSMSASQKEHQFSAYALKVPDGDLPSSLQTSKQQALIFSLENVDVALYLKQAAEALERACLMVKVEMAERYHTPFTTYVEENSEIVAKPSIRRFDGYGMYDVAMVPQLILSHVLAVQGELDVTGAVLLKSVRMQRAAMMVETVEGPAASTGADGDSFGNDAFSETGSLASIATGSVAAGYEEMKAERNRQGSSGKSNVAVFGREDIEEQQLLIRALRRFEAAAIQVSSGLSDLSEAIVQLKKPQVIDDDASIESSDSVLSLGSGRYYKSKKYGRLRRVAGQSLSGKNNTGASPGGPPPVEQYAVDIDTAAEMLKEPSFNPYSSQKPSQNNLGGGKLSQKNSVSAAADGLSRHGVTLDDLATKTANKDVALVADLVDAYQSLRLMAKGDETSVNAVATSTAAALASVGVMLSNVTGKVKQRKKKIKPNRYPSGHVRELRYQVGAVDVDKDEEQPITVKSEMMPFVKRHGRSVVSTYLQWALSVTGGIGYGFMGLGSHSSMQQSVEMNCMSTESGQLLWEVYARLAQLEADFRKEDAESKVNRQSYRVEEQRNRFLLNVVMAKVSMQLGMKEECARAVDMMTKVLAELKKNTKPPVGEVVFSALALRFQLDLEQLQIPLAVSCHTRMHALMETIAKAKEYLSFAEKTRDVQLQRDALKRIANALVEVGVMAQFVKDEEEAMKVEKSAVKKKTTTTTAVGVKAEDLLKWSPKELEKLEVDDEKWVAKFGRLRALYYLDKMRALVPVEADEGETRRNFVARRRSTFKEVPGGLMKHKSISSHASSIATKSRGDDDEEEDEDDDEDDDDSDDEDDDDDGDADSVIDETAEHEAMLKYTRDQASEWNLSLETYATVTSTRPKAETSGMGGGMFFFDKAKRRLEEMESEDRASTGLHNNVLRNDPKVFRDFFDFGIKVVGSGEEISDESNGEDSDPETKRRRRQEEEARHRDDASLASQDESLGEHGKGRTSKLAHGGKRVPPSVKGRAAARKGAKSPGKHVTMVDGEEVPHEDESTTLDPPPPVGVRPRGQSPDTRLGDITADSTLTNMKPEMTRTNSTAREKSNRK